MKTRVLQDILRGQWYLSRTIQDKRQEKTALMTGIAIFDSLSGRQDCLWYMERGNLTWDSYSGESYQNYLYSFRDNFIADLFFPDGRFFHTLDLSQSKTTITHFCEKDRYEGHYTLYNMNHLEVEWVVNGVRKNYSSKTVFNKK